LFAIRTKNLEIVTLLLSAKADVNYVDKKGESPLIAAVASQCDVELIQLLLNHKAQVDYVSPDHGTALAVAMEEGHVEAFKRLSELPTQKWQFVNKSGQTLLHLAVKSKNADFVKKVLTHVTEEELDAQDSEGDTPLHLAARKDSMEIILELMNAGCDPTKVNRKRQNVFTTATEASAEYITELLQDPTIEETLRLKREKEAERERAAELLRIEERDAKVQAIWRSKSETPKRSPGSRSSQGRGTATKSGRVRGRESPSERDAQMREPIQARYWGGSAEAEQFQRNVRVRLRNLKRDVHGWLDELEQDLNTLKEELLGDANEEEEETE
jgi:hypothetical protein